MSTSDTGYGGVHSADHQADQNKNKTIRGGYDLEIFMNEDIANDYICAMYASSTVCPFTVFFRQMYF